MQIAVFIIYEILIRLQELDPDLGEYLMNRKTEDGILVRTSNGSIPIPDSILLRQFNDPKSISQFELQDLLGNFKLS
ncbi:hypothetical protein EZ428_18240 [Pedobacter frigiditerrae]|uniref:Uncharacterized protein n=1 Tax=Pedobacter frigiditerrae TaxID=2530452 RepID=A0A4R0MP28_9SPHI|nr:hypothetical protein [Pedobacter frigiditerrae]TCC88581.1 hypothetical protein EZ428_18240 [Pedobacter frigiditerrae]